MHKQIDMGYGRIALKWDNSVQTYAKFVIRRSRDIDQ